MDPILYRKKNYRNHDFGLNIFLPTCSKIYTPMSCKSCFRGLSIFFFTRGKTFNYDSVEEIWSNRS